MKCKKSVSKYFKLNTDKIKICFIELQIKAITTSHEKESKRVMNTGFKLHHPPCSYDGYIQCIRGKG